MLSRSYRVAVFANSIAATFIEKRGRPTHDTHKLERERERGRERENERYEERDRDRERKRERGRCYHSPGVDVFVGDKLLGVHVVQEPLEALTLEPPSEFHPL